MSYAPLDQLSIASPCSADWQEMVGDDQKRFCQHCQLNVYNLSGMSRQEAESLILQSEGRLCVRYFQRQDGSILTQDCPVGLRALYRGRLRRFGKVAAAVSILTVAGLFYVQGAVAQETSPGTMRMGEAVAPPPHVQGGLAPVRQPGAEPSSKPERLLTGKKACKQGTKPIKHPAHKKKDPAQHPSPGQSPDVDKTPMMGKVRALPNQETPKQP